MSSVSRGVPRRHAPDADPSRVPPGQYVTADFPVLSAGPTPRTALRDRLMSRLREQFRPEFLNRIDDIVIFRQLDQAELTQITELLLGETRRRLRAQDVTVRFTPAAVTWIAEHGYQPEFGARPLRRTIQREVDNHMSRLLLDGQIAAGQQVSVDVRDGQLTFNVDQAVGADSGQPG